MDIFIYLIFTLIGVVLGTLTGLTPGFHVNNIAVIALFLYSQNITDPVYLAGLIISAMIAHTFLDFIPSTFLGAPAEDTALSVLPMHRMLLDGNGYRAVYLSAIGSILAVLFALPLLPIFQIFFSCISYDSLKYFIPPILTSIILYMLYLESKKSIKNMLFAMDIIILSGTLGIIVFSFPLNGNFIPLNMDSSLLFPVFVGLFGIPTLFLSRNAVVPEQKIEKIETTRKNNYSSFLGTLSGSLVGFLPGITSGIGATLSRGFFKDEDSENFVVALGSVNTANSIFNLAALFIILHPRSEAVNIIGSMVPVEQWVSLISVPSFLTLLLLSIAISSFLSFFITIYIGKMFALKMGKFGESYGKISKIILISLFILIFLFTGPVGIMFSLISSFIGYLPPKLGIMRVHLMSVIIFPVILIYLGLI